MFTKTASTTIKVLKLDFKPSKAEEQLSEWTDQGWTLRSTEAVQLLSQTAFLLAFLEPPK